MAYPLLLMRLPDCASRSSRTAVTTSPASSWSSTRPSCARPVVAEYAIHSGGDQRHDPSLAIDHMVIMHL